MNNKDPLSLLTTKTLQNLLNILPFPFALVHNRKIIWTSNYFKTFVENYSLEENIINTLSISNLSKDKKTEIKLTDEHNFNLFIIPINKENSDDYYLLSINNLRNNTSKIKEIAHDLNNNLNTIINSIDILKDKLKHTEEIDYLLNSITNHSNMAIEHATVLLEDGNRNKILYTKINLNKLISDIYNTFKISLPEEINLKLEITDEPCEINGSYNDIHSVLLNLLINAKESIEQKGSIFISLKKSRESNTEKDINVKDNEYAIITIKDSGLGIDEKAIHKIFDKGFSTKDKSYTSGIGLFNVKEIISNHNGKIDVESKLKSGTEFRIYLPLSSKITFDESFAKEKTILIAEDEESLLNLLSELFTSYKFKVIPVSSGSEVLSVLDQKIKIDLLIIDRKMPDMNGIDCILEIQQRGLTFPVILATGSVNEDVENIDKSKVAALIRKPYSFDDILSLAESLIV